MSRTGPPRGPRNQTKPCKCGRHGCLVIQRENEKPSNFSTRKFASIACSLWRNSQRIAELKRGGPPPSPAEVDKRLAQAVEMKRQNPKRSIMSIARELKMDAVRAREAMCAAGVLTPRKPCDQWAAPAWYDQPCGRIVAQRQAQGISP